MNNHRATDSTLGFKYSLHLTHKYNIGLFNFVFFKCACETELKGENRWSHQGI
jgi:hypothetical protein